MRVELSWVLERSKMIAHTWAATFYGEIWRRRWLLVFGVAKRRLPFFHRCDGGGIKRVRKAVSRSELKLGSVDPVSNSSAYRVTRQSCLDVARQHCTDYRATGLYTYSPSFVDRRVVL